MTVGRGRAMVVGAVTALAALTALPLINLSGAAADTRGSSTVQIPAQIPAPQGETQRPEAANDVLPSPAVYPQQSLPLNFDHAAHTRREIACERCHQAATRSLTSKDDLLPAEQVCRACHAIDRTQPAKKVAAGEGPARCDVCHPSLAAASAGSLSAAPPDSATLADLPRVVIPAPALKFNHRLHVSRGMACSLCHVGVENTKMATTAHLPKMGLCLGCHDGRQATARCSACHLTTADGRLRTNLPGGMLIPSGSLRGVDAHTPAFRTQHRVAGRDERYCATCHKQNECTECHGAGVIKPADFHPVDYATLHAVDARRNSPNCASCHRNQTFCLGCHQRLGVAPDPEGGQAGRQPNNPFGTGTGVKRFHPPGWVRDESGVVLSTPTPASHSFQARRNLRTCVSCHREESCLNCHSADPTRSMAVNPHPPGFSGSATCKALSSRNSRACLKCHAPGAPALSCD